MPPKAPHQRFRVVSRVDLAQILGTHTDTISKYVAEGMPVLKAGGQGKEAEYDVLACLAWQRAKRTPGTDAQERARYFRAQADKTEQEVQRRAGTLVEASAVAAEWANLVLPLREAVLGLATLLLQHGLIRAADEDAVLALLHGVLGTLAERGKEPDGLPIP